MDYDPKDFGGNPSWSDDQGPGWTNDQKPPDHLITTLPLIL